MKALNDILKNVKILERRGPEDAVISNIAFDSRKASGNSLFVAVSGTRVDGHDYIPDAVSAGSNVVVCEKIPGNIPGQITVVRVPDSKEALGLISANYFGNPSRKLKLVGITGTNGKTTVATLLHSLFEKLDHRSGLISTVRNMVSDVEVAATHTTPDPLQTNELMKAMVEENCEYCFMEVSSHAIDQRRIAGLGFAGAVFTNITHEHLDYHGNFETYLGVKKQFFDALPSGAFALTNIDDRNGRVMLQNTRAVKKTYGLKGMADFKCRIIEGSMEGLHLNIDGEELWVHLTGRFNAYNILAVYAAARILGEEKERILTSISSLPPVEGRFEPIRAAGNITGIVDYAHTPDALDNVLSALSGVRTGNESLICVFGAGGDRDPSKRQLMGRIAVHYSDKVIITSDNPRNEDPQKIIADIMKGINAESGGKVVSIISREEAIRAACMMANPGDIILVAGKGHEKYQCIGNERIHFDDREVLKKYLLLKTNRR